MSAAPGRLQGVDLRLDNFDLSEAKRVTLETQSRSWGDLVKPLDECHSLGEAFWSALEGDSSPFKESDQALFRAIFNPCLSDRRADGVFFVPPDANYSHVTKLHVLVKEEEAVRQQRQTAFCSKDFMLSRPGVLFPSSWTCKFEVLRGDAPMRALEGRPLTSLTEIPEYQFKAKEMLHGILKTAGPIFEKSTEEGMRFRIYRVGSLEVRTTQELDCDEAVGAIFSIRDPQIGAGACSRHEQALPEERIVKATEYVERIHLTGALAGHRRFYSVLETEKGHKILTERREDGLIIWEEDPQKLDDRNSMAKVLRSKDCKTNVTLGDLKKCADASSQGSPASRSVCKLWARSIFADAAGEAVKSTLKATKRQEDPALAVKRKEEQAQKSAQNQALAERNTSFIPLSRSQPATLS